MALLTPLSIDRRFRASDFPLDRRWDHRFGIRGLRSGASILLALALLLSIPGIVGAVRIKDIVDIRGVRSNQLVGYGVVVGLDGTGDDDKSELMNRGLSRMLDHLGVSVRPEEIDSDNAAAVVVTADLPPFARSGSRIDVTVSALGDAENLQGGTLVLTPLRAADGRIYAVAQGAVSTGGFAAGGAAGSIQKNFPTVGRIPGGALVEGEVNAAFGGDRLVLALKRPDFTTAIRTADAINAALGANLARTPDPGTVEVRVPDNLRADPVRFVTRIEGISVTPDTAARVVINERTGTVVVGENVRISTVAIAHGNLSIQIRETATVSQPEPFSDTGVTVVVPETEIGIQEEDDRLVLLESAATIGEVVRALNALGVTPRDLIAIFQAIKAAGALQAELEII
jgi:flagellar P-ring protein precursor FlgI